MALSLSHKVSQPRKDPDKMFTNCPTPSIKANEFKGAALRNFFLRTKKKFGFALKKSIISRQIRSGTQKALARESRAQMVLLHEINY
jgi:hypothetical protein